MGTPSRASGLTEPNWSAPLITSNYVAGAPADGTVKGMFFTCISKMARDKSGEQLGREHYTRFKSYPLSEWLELLPQCAARAYPTLPLRAALFETGSHIYRTFSESTIGRVVMSVAGRDVQQALKLVARAYDSVGSYANVKLATLEDRRAVIEMRNMWEFPDCYQAGILAAGVRAYGESPKVRVQVHGLSNVDVELTW